MLSYCRRCRQLQHFQNSIQARNSSSRSASSNKWLQRQRADPFVKARGKLSPGADDFVARSAFKLIELNDKYQGRIVRKGATIVDLGAAPGGWVQAVNRIISESPGRPLVKTHIFALDLLPLHPSVASLPNVTFIQGDFLSPSVQTRLKKRLLNSDSSEGGGGGGGGGTGEDSANNNTTLKVDLVLSDMLPNLTGNPLRDAQQSLDVCEAALQFAVDHLRPSSSSSSRAPSRTSHTTNSAAPLGEGPSFLIKFLQSDLSPSFGKKLRSYFDVVKWEKPTSSRAESREGYWVCSGFKGGLDSEGGWKEGERERSKVREGSIDEGESSVFF
ncbi:FtsJ-domain-containing protein [Meredithblackwellia eburnea MCA 4105]